MHPCICHRHTLKVPLVTSLSCCSCWKIIPAHDDTGQDSELVEGLGSAKEVDDDKVEDQVAEEEVGKGTLLRDVLELSTVLGVDLDAQTDCTKINQKKCTPSRD